MSTRSPRVGAPSLARGAAIITVATAVSRVTGFVRVLVVAGAMGTTFLANTYQTANTAPNLLFELVAAGVLTSVFVPTFVDYLVKGQEDEGWNAANVLTSVALIGLIGLALLLAFTAPVVMRVLTLGVGDETLRQQEIALGARWLRLFAPQIVFYGAGMIMTAALHAHRRFAIPAIAPILNNVVVIGVYLGYAAMRGGRPPTVAGITDAEVFLLGAGTTLGVVAMTLVLVPDLYRVGWRFRFVPTLAHPAVRRALRLGVWALGYAGGYQAGLVVVLALANDVAGGVAAYQWAYTFFYVPHALVGVPIFHVLFPEMAERAARGEEGEFLTKLRDGLRMVAFILAFVAAALVALAFPLARATLEYGVMTGAGADLVARVIAAFAIGLPTFSIFLILTRAFYAIGDTRTPALVNGATVVGASVIGATLFFTLPAAWAVPGLALGHSIAFVAGAVALARLLRSRTGRLGDRGFVASLRRSAVVGLVALGAMVALRIVVPADTRTTSVLSLAIVGAVGAVVYYQGMRMLRAPELHRVQAVMRRGRR